MLKPLLTPILTLQPTGGTVSVSNQSVGTVRVDPALVLRGREAAYVDQLTRQSVLPLRPSEQELADLRLFSKELSLPVSLVDQVVATREPV